MNMWRAPTQLIAAPGWSNGRDVGTWVKRIFSKYALRTSGSPAAGAGASSTTQGEPAVTVSDLQQSLTEFITSKAAPAETAAAQPGGPSPASALADALSSLFAPKQQQTPAAPAYARAPPRAAPAPPQFATARAPPAVSTRVEIREVQAGEDDMEVEDEDVVVEETFAGLSTEFLQAMQSSLEELGVDLTSEDAMEQLGGDGSLPDSLVPALRKTAAGGKVDPAILKQMVKQWQQAIPKQMQLKRELAKKKQVPVWRCAVCGRYGCPVAPYIERYDEI